MAYNPTQAPHISIFSFQVRRSCHANRVMISVHSLLQCIYTIIHHIHNRVHPNCAANALSTMPPPPVPTPKMQKPLCAGRTSYVQVRRFCVSVKHIRATIIFLPCQFRRASACRIFAGNKSMALRGTSCRNPAGNSSPPAISIKIRPAATQQPIPEQFHAG